MGISGLDYQSSNIDGLHQKINDTLYQLASTKEENINLKLKISELEFELTDERELKARKFDSHIDSFKSNLNQQILD